MTLANLVTLLRLLLVPLVVWLYLAGANVLSAAVFSVAAMTDALDGWLARTRGEVSATGKWLDPLADKALQLAALVLVALGGLVPWWLVLFLLIKEMGLVLGGVWFLRRGQVFGSRLWGKLGSLLLFVALAGTLAGYAALRPLLFLGACLSVLAGLDYLALAVAFSRPRHG